MQLSRFIWIMVEIWNSSPKVLSLPTSTSHVTVTPFLRWFLLEDALSLAL
uniref:Uncharacterized protein n=1 Tax=Zea mays TaxID=4577 RepID=C4J2C2_MAIZE|nr:unknown [Zea mays]